MNDYEFFGNVSDALMPQLKEIEDKGKTEVELYDALHSYTKKHRVRHIYIEESK